MIYWLQTFFALISTYPFALGVGTDMKLRFKF